MTTRALAASACLVLLLGACGGGSGPKARDGDTVSVFYTGQLDNGTVFDTNVGGDPLTFTLGSNQVIPGFEDAVTGHQKGDTFSVRIEAADAYGEWSEDYVFDVSSEGAPEGLEPGDPLTLSNGAIVTVVEVGEDTIRVDANPPLAGQALKFDIEVVEVTR